MATCKTCANTRTVDHGLDVGMCRDCQPDVAAIRDLLDHFPFGDATREELNYHTQLTVLVDRWEELVRALKPADWQTPLQRAQELRDNLMVTGHIKELVSRS